MYWIPEGASIRGLRQEILHACDVAGEVYESEGFRCELSPNGEAGGTHGVGSLHYNFLACDFRTKDIPPNRRQFIRDKIKAVLGAEYDVVLESTHLHCEFQPKGPLGQKLTPSRKKKKLKKK